MMFYRVRVQTFILDMPAIQRQDGLENMLGGHALIAQIMGPDEDIAIIADEKEMLVCAPCMMHRELGMLLEGE